MLSKSNKNGKKIIPPTNLTKDPDNIHWFEQFSKPINSSLGDHNLNNYFMIL